MFNPAFKDLGFIKDESGRITSIFSKNPKDPNKHDKPKKEYQYLRSQDRDTDQAQEQK